METGQRFDSRAPSRSPEGRRLKRILFAEDDDIIAELAVMALEDIGGFDVRHCTSGFETLDAAKSFQPELVLLDVMMPGMDGLETLSRLRRLPGMSKTPAVFMSAKVQRHECESYMTAGACGVVTKPFDPDTLPQVLQEFWIAATDAHNSKSPSDIQPGFGPPGAPP